MNIPRLAAAMGYIDDDLISAAEVYKPVSKKTLISHWKPLVAVAACLVIVLSIGIFTLNIDPSANNPTAHAAPAHFYFENNCYIFTGELVYSLPENFDFVSEIKNVGDTFTGIDFEGNVDGYVYMNDSDKSVAYFDWRYWDESVDGEEPYLVMRIRNG